MSTETIAKITAHLAAGAADKTNGKGAVTDNAAIVKKLQELAELFGAPPATPPVQMESHAESARKKKANHLNRFVNALQNINKENDDRFKASVEKFGFKRIFSDTEKTVYKRFGDKNEYEITKFEKSFQIRQKGRATFSHGIRNEFIVDSLQKLKL